METRGPSALKEGKKYTLEDWRSWPEEERWELIHGTAFDMSPAPRLRHQRILGKLFTQFAAQLEGKSCEPFIAPVDLFLTTDGTDPAALPEDEANTVVQPDMMIVCSPEKCRENGIFGPPDWILEILSPSTSYKDQTEKKNLYEKAGVREYWVLNPDTLDLIMYKLEKATYGVPLGARLDSPTALGIFPEVVLFIPIR